MQDICQTSEERLAFHSWLNRQLEGEYHDHGVFSAILLLKESSGWKQQLEKKVVNECALAIALHNYHKALSGDKKLIAEEKLPADESPANELGLLNIKDYPLAYLLAYCDIAQEWGRPSSRQPSNYTIYEDMNINKENKEIFILLRYNLCDFIKIESKMGKTFSDNTDAMMALWSKESERFEKLRDSWVSDQWKYGITQIVFDNSYELGRINSSLCTEKKKQEIPAIKPPHTFEEEKQAI